MNKVVYVKAQFAEKGFYETVQVPTGKTETTYLGFEREVTLEKEQFVPTGFSDCEINAAQLALDVGEAVERLNAEGYEVVALTPVTSGRHHDELVTSVLGEARGGFGYGFSYTKGMIIVARRVSS